jgi:hypothetical protein
MDVCLSPGDVLYVFELRYQTKDTRYKHPFHGGVLSAMSVAAVFNDETIRDIYEANVNMTVTTRQGRDKRALIAGEFRQPRHLVHGWMFHERHNSVPGVLGSFLMSSRAMCANPQCSLQSLRNPTSMDKFNQPGTSTGELNRPGTSTDKFNKLGPGTGSVQPGETVSDAGKLGNHSTETKCAELTVQQLCSAPYAGKSTWDFKMCARCRLMRYCSAECQRADWIAHKPTCQRLQRSSATLIDTPQARS